MKKQVLYKLYLVLLPAMAVVLATTGDSVMMFDRAAGTTEYASYFTPVNVGGLTLLPPLAAILAIVSAALAVIYAVYTKAWCLRGILATGFVSATCATVPILIQSGDVLVVPNAILPVLMLLTAGIAAWVSKKPAGAEEKHGVRLK